jgi:propanol-preferring alcohol dehydrogenase
MKAAVLYKPGKPLVLEERNIPKIEKGEALVRVVRTCLCGTDLKIWDGTINTPLPLVPGHEVAGKIVDAAPANDHEKEIIETIKKEYNENVLIYMYIGCNQCYYCRSGEKQLCPRVKRIGFDVDGGFAEYIKVPIINLVPLPNSLDYDAAILADAGETVYRAFKKMPQRPGATIVIMGSGGLGSFAILLAKLLGYQVVTIDVIDEKLLYAKELGSDYIFKAQDKENAVVLADEILRTIGERVYAFIDFVGNAYSQEVAMNVLDKKGYILQIGYSSKETYNRISIQKLVWNEYNILGSVGGSINDLYEVINLVSKRKIKLPVSKIFKLDEINIALQTLKEGKALGRICISPE